MAENYQQQSGIVTGPRGVVVDIPGVVFRTNTAATFNALATGTGLVHTVTISPVATGTIQIFDALTAVGTPIFDSGALAAGNPFTVTLDILFSTGLSMIVGVAASLVTISFRQK